MTATSGTLAGLGALVTGGGSGIGLACARALLVDGASVTLMGRTEDKLRHAAAELEAAAPDGAAVRWAAGDVASEDDVVAAVAAACEPEGGLDLVVASAGTAIVGSVLDLPVAEYERVTDTNTRGTFLTLKHAGAALRARGGGAFCAISSLAGVRVHRWMSVYNASKAAVDMLVRTAADEWGPLGIRVNGVQPGLVDTELASIVTVDDAIVGSYLEATPLGRYATADEIASVVRFLVGPESVWVNGVTIPVDGGEHLRQGPDYGSLTRALYGPDATPGFAAP